MSSQFLWFFIIGRSEERIQVEPRRFSPTFLAGAGASQLWEAASGGLDEQSSRSSLRYEPPPPPPKPSPLEPPPEKPPLEHPILPPPVVRGWQGSVVFIEFTERLGEPTR